MAQEHTEGNCEPEPVVSSGKGTAKCSFKWHDSQCTMSEHWRGRWEGGSGWGIHVYPWLIHVNV